MYANFNQDCGCFVAGTKRGFRIFNSDPLRQKQVRGIHLEPCRGDRAPKAAPCRGYKCRSANHVHYTGQV